ncbi:hypothetical protein JOM56_005570 [Amanita muscaria]
MATIRTTTRNLTRNALRANQTIQHLNLGSRTLFQATALSKSSSASVLCRPASIKQAYPRSCQIPESRNLSTSQPLNQSETKTKQETQETQEQTKSNNDNDTGRQDASGGKEIPPEWWINALEATANAPWLFHLPNEPVDRLKRAFTLLFQIILYLGRPQEEGVAIQFLNAFHSAVVPPESEIGRARRAVANITRAVVHDISSIPLTSPLRGEQVRLFEIFDALQPLHDVYLENMREGEVDAGEWSEFWKRAEPVLLTLGETLDQGGFGLQPDERRASGREEKEQKEGTNGAKDE